jgi:hypothetical protein
MRKRTADPKGSKKGAREMLDLSIDHLFPRRTAE